jgi:hypothetical protein
LEIISIRTSLTTPNVVASHHGHGRVGERVREDDPTGDIVARGPLDHAEREFMLRLEDDVLRDPGLSPSIGVLGPGLGQEQREVDRHVLAARRDGQAHGDPAVCCLACRPRILPLHAH